MRNIIKRTINNIIGYAWSLFLNGLLTLLPLTLTIALLNFSFKLLKSWLEPIRQIQPPFLKAIPHAEIILALLVTVFVGAVLKIFILRSIVHWFERLIFKVPLIRPLYSGLKQLVHAFNPQDKITFKSVVLIQFPRLDIYSIGFLTGEMPKEIAPDTSAYVNVFIPTTPNPTTGYLIFVPMKDVITLDLSRQEAMALIISGGIIQPERFKKE